MKHFVVLYSVHAYRNTEKVEKQIKKNAKTLHTKKETLMEEHCIKTICERRLRRHRKRRVNRSQLNTKHMFLGIFADVFEGISIVLFFSK